VGGILQGRRIYRSARGGEAFCQDDGFTGGLEEGGLRFSWLQRGTLPGDPWSGSIDFHVPRGTPPRPRKQFGELLLVPLGLCAVRRRLERCFEDSLSLSPFQQPVSLIRNSVSQVAPIAIRRELHVTPVAKDEESAWPDLRASEDSCSPSCVARCAVRQ